MPVESGFSMGLIWDVEGVAHRNAWERVGVSEKDASCTCIVHILTFEDVANSAIKDAPSMTPLTNRLWVLQV